MIKGILQGASPVSKTDELRRRFLSFGGRGTTINGDGRILRSVSDEMNRASALRDAVETEPETVDVDDVVDLLVHGDRATRRTAFEVYEQLVTVRPAATAAAARLEAHLTDDSAEIRRRAALTAGALVERHPDAFERIVPELRSIGDDSDESGRESAIVALSKLALERPAAVIPAVDTLLKICHEPVAMPTEPLAERGFPDVESGRGTVLKQERELRDSVRVPVIAALTLVAAEDPTALRDSVSSVADLFEDDHHLVRAAACEILEAVATECPGDVEPLASELAARVASDTKHPVPWRAADALVALEAERPERVGEVVAPVAEDLSRFLESRDADRRRIGVTLLADAASVRPAAVEPTIPTLRELLADDAASVRLKAALALGFTGASSARSALAEVAETDSNESIRDAAAHSLERLKRLDTEGE